MTDRVIVEVCCGSVDDAIEAQKGGADRIELNSALALGGLTPSGGSLIEATRQLDIPVMVMIRPRTGGFCYSRADMEAMLADVQKAVANGTDGIVFGILNAEGTIDIDRRRRVIESADGVETVFHRAFDVVPDPNTAIETLIELGITRILTSGQQTTAMEGMPLLWDLIGKWGEHVEILSCGKIRPDNVRRIVELTSASQVHLGTFTERQDTSAANRGEIRFNKCPELSEDRYEIINQNTIAEIRKALDD